MIMSESSVVSTEFEVECILEKRNTKGRTDYLVKWKDYPEDQATWEPSKALSNCRDAVREFEARHSEPLRVSRPVSSRGAKTMQKATAFSVRICGQEELAELIGQKSRSYPLFAVTVLREAPFNSFARTNNGNFFNLLSQTQKADGDLFLDEKTCRRILPDQTRRYRHKSA